MEQEWVTEPAGKHKQGTAKASQGILRWEEILETGKRILYFSVKH